MKNGQFFTTIWGFEYDLGAYRDSADFSGSVWFDVFAWSDNADHANDAERTAIAVWKKEVE